MRALVYVLVLTASALMLAASVLWLSMESELGRPAAPPADEAARLHAAFTAGPIGLEVLPVKYAAVLEELSGPAFGIAEGSDGAGLWESYGFLPSASAGEAGAARCVDNAATWLPYGFTVTHRLPATSATVPVAFAGLACSACHSSLLRLADGSVTPVIDGAANQGLNIGAFGEGFKNAILDPRLDAAAILDKYAEICGSDETGLLTGTIERYLIDQWLDGTRAVVGADTAKYELPYPLLQIGDSSPLGTGPGRTDAFRSVVRVNLNLPGSENEVYSKIPVVFEQDIALRPRAQFDGSIGDPVVRSLIAAYASGASLTALAEPDVEASIREAAAYTEQLGIATPVPGFADLFPALAPEPDMVAAGSVVYREHCAACHGYRDADSGQWVAEGARIHDWELLDSIGTDPERVTFRYADLLPLGLWTAFPGYGEPLDLQRDALQAAAEAALAEGRPSLAFLWESQLERLETAAQRFRQGHPLTFAQRLPDAEVDVLTDEVGYFNNPIPGAFLRAPYLHNGSVPTMRQLINLDPRPDRFCRGLNTYDPAAMGYDAPEPSADGTCPDGLYFVFDAGERGNSNQGHDYPWPPGHPDYDREQLEALLAYLRTL